MSAPAPHVAVSSSCDVSIPAPVPTSSVKPQVNQVSDSGPSLGGFKSILDDFRQSISSVRVITVFTVFRLLTDFVCL
jgi:hypothetical protein